MKHLLLFFSLFLTFNISFAQHSIQSSVFDSKNGLPIELGTVRLLRASDSTLVQGCQTDARGGFILSKIKTGDYKLIISSVGYQEYRRNISMENKDLILKNIQLNENIQLLKEVDVSGTAAQMVVKGDTLEYNATAFKTPENSVVEDLLKKMPGVEVGSDGKITINGEEIKKVRVDGKKFFSDDIQMATKNIPAEMIDKVQVLDQKSDMAQLTGFEDDDTERIINLTTKANRKKGIFGNVTAGGGIDLNKDFRYDANAFLNIVNGDAQTAITGGANNVNTSRSSRGRNWGGGNNAGITSTQNIGVNNNTIINTKLKAGGDASFNHTANESITENNKESYLKGSVYTDSTYSIVHNENYSANMRLELEWKPDTLNTFVFQPNINYNRSFSDSNNDFLYLTDNDSTSWGHNSSYGNGSSLDGGLNLIYSHKFAKPGRTITANLNTTISQSNNESYNYSLKNAVDSTTLVDQKTNNVSDRYNISMRVSYVEPLWNMKNMLEATVAAKTSISSSEKDQYNKDNNGVYNQFDSIYSNNFDNSFYSETLELRYRYTDTNYKIMLGLKGEPSQTHSLRIYENGVTRAYDNSVFNFAPTGRFQYNFGRKKFARIDYRGQTSQPSISQMQPVKNNSNQMNETVGNPTLNPSFTHNLRMMYSSFNSETFSSFNTMFSANATKDALVANSIYDATGKQYSQTVNAKAIPYSLNASVMYNTPIIQKRLHFNTRTSGSFEKHYGYSSKGLNSEDIDVDNLKLGDLSSTRNYSAREQLSLTFTNDNIEIGARGSVNYSNTLNNLNPVLSETWDWSGQGNFMVHLPYNINIGSDINFTTRQGYSNFDQNELLWNASIDKTIFKNRGVLALKWNDILHQRLNIRQTIGDNYIQYSKYNTLTSYIMLSFSYKISKFNGSKNPADMRMDRFGPGGDHQRRMDRGGDGPGGGPGGGGPEM